MGLIDEIGDTYQVAKDVFDAPKIVDYTVGSSVLDRLAKKVGATVSKSLSPKASFLEFAVKQ